ncbi:MAG: hypothetical protein ATN35_02860 [Epulopiscium sp. Nele67-Bin004]|nr:MAG: hypothetical protein ATN35_02860 [Epulopiscium sp. Nele67-Bin004]
MIPNEFYIIVVYLHGINNYFNKKIIKQVTTLLNHITLTIYILMAFGFILNLTERHISILTLFITIA